MKKIVASFAVFFSLVAFCYAYQSPGSPQGFVTDFAGVLTTEEKNSLETKLGAFQKDTTNEVAVVTIHSLDGDTIENYANELFREWGIGTKQNNNGVLFLVAVDDHKMRIEVGYGLEGAVTDIGTKQLQDDVAAPAFRKGDYFSGIDGVVDGLIKMSKGEYVAPASSTTNEGLPKIIVFILIWGSIVFPWLIAIFARSKSWWAGGVAGGVVGILISLFLNTTMGLIAMIPLIGVGLLFDYVVSRSYTGFKSGDKKHIPWWAGGGGFGGGSSSGGGFGGFGGGSSGGGGSSSSW